MFQEVPKVSMTLLKHEAEAIGRLVCSMMGKHAHDALGDPALQHFQDVRTVSLNGRIAGRNVFRHWQDGPGFLFSLQAAVEAAKRFVGANDFARISVLELFLQVGAPYPFTPDMAERPMSNKWRHRHALGIRHEGRISRMSPTGQTSQNLSVARSFELLEQQLKIAPGTGERIVLPGHSLLIDVKKQETYILRRGQPLVQQSDITSATVRLMADQMTQWLVRQVAPDGKTTYAYWPSSGEYSKSNNMIRQFMGSACLALAAGRYPDASVVGACARNFRYNFASFCEQRDGFAVINEFGKIKLGAAGVAVTAILNLPDPAPWVNQQTQLLKFLEYMQQEDGSFRTFLEPADRNDNQNFYPGEALLALVMVYQRNPSPELLDRIERGFRYYRQYFRENQNPAFVPWHTQAYCLLHDVTGSKEVADFVFEMNDWLLGMQETSAELPEIQGDFFDPRRPGYGPPHASATGVYLEGLIEAWRLAIKLGEHTRAENYRRSMVMGLRMLRQLQFRTDIDMFYSTKRERIQGGVRTTLYDNTIRIDNVQHGLMAIYRIVDRFSDADYKL